MKQKIRVKRKHENPIYGLFVAGFLLGVLIPNIMWREVYAQAGMVSAYLIECLGDLKTEEYIFLFDVIQKRAGMAILTAVLGMSIFGIPVSIFMMILQAFEFGSILTCSILQFGIQGGLIGVALLFPHGLLYMIGMLGICSNALRKSAETWKNDNIFNKQIYKYWGKMLIFILFICGGIMMEVYVSPVLIKFIIKNLGIFS